MKKFIFSFLWIIFFVFTSQAQDHKIDTTGSFVGAGPDAYTYQGVATRLYASGGVSYTWTPSAGLSNPNEASPYVTVDDTTTFIVAIQLPSDSIVYDTAIVFILGPFSSSSASCSNLVTNGDFETHTSTCNGTVNYFPTAQPVGYPFSMPNNWVTPNTASPDYYNACSTTNPPNPNQSVNVPYTDAGYQSAHSGNGYYGFIPYEGPLRDWSEYGQQALGCTMLSGQKYKVTYYLALPTLMANACSDIGAYLSTGPITSTTTAHFSNVPQITTGTVIIGTNTVTTTAGTTTVTNNTAGSWGSVSGIVTGAGQNYITIGCFMRTPTLSLLNSGGNTNYVNYFLDDVSITPLPPVITTINVTTCSGATFTLCATGGANYTWTGPGISGSLSGSCVNITAPTVTTTTIYSYTVTTTLTCPSTCSYTTAVTVTVTPAPVITVNSATICSGSQATLTVTGSNTYSWTPSTGLSPTTGSVVTANPTSTTVYTVIGVSTSGCVSTTTSTVTVNPNPTIVVSNTTICNGNSATMTASGASTYTWNPGGTGNPIVLSPTTTTGYTVTGTSSAGCIGSTTFTITVNPKPTLTVSATPSSKCVSTTTNTTALSVSGASTYTWNPPFGTSLSCPNCTTPTATITGYSAFIFTVTATNATGCTNTATVSATFNPIPTVIVNSATICPGSTTTLTASGATTYTWSANAGSATTSTVAVTPTVTTSYTVTGTANTCTNSATSTVTVYPAPTVPTFTGNLCPSITGTVSVSSGAGYTYSWTPSTGTNSVSCSTCTLVTINNPSGVYTVIATYTATGCKANGTFSTSPNPTVNISSAPTNSYCAYSPVTVTLTASGASTYSWNTGPTTTTISVSPSATTGYTVTGTNTQGCKNTVSSTVTVVPTPTISPSVTPNPVCQGLTATLTATGATNYTWSPGGLTGGTVTVTPSSNTTYTVTGAVSTCTANASITLSVTPAPTITVTSSTQSSCNYTAPGTNTICAGGSATFTATSSLTSYTWNPGGVSGNPVTVTPTVTTIYTVTGSGSGCPGTQTFTLTVSNCNCAGTALPVLTNTTITGGNYVLNANATVTGNVTLNATDIKIAPSVTITVQNGAYLQIIGSHLSACYNMWQGIVVQQGGRVDITHNSLIEDAKVAIDNNPTNTLQTGTPSTIIISGAVFNCNSTAIRKAYYEDGNGNLTTGNYNTNYFKVNDAVITCRCGLPFPITTGTLTVYTNTVTGTPNPAAPDLSDFYSVTNYTLAALKPPLFGIPAYDGVRLENVGYPVPQTVSPLPFVNIIGGATLVLFDNLTYGINATNATFSVTNTAYQTPQKIGGFGRTPPNVGGYGINAINTSPDFYNGIYVNNSRFIDEIRGINSTNYFDIDVNNNILFSRQFITPYGQISTAIPPGDYGMYFGTTRFIGADMYNNNIGNINNGIIFSIGNTPGYNGGNGQYVGQITVNNNTLTAQFPGNSYTNRYIGNAIAVGNVLTPIPGSTVTPVAGTTSQIYARGNTITNAFNGISMSNHQFQEIRDEQNTIILQYQPTIITESNQYGIQHANNIYQLSGSGYGDEIYLNTITGITGGTVQATFEKKKGIWSRFGANHYITCNTVTSGGRGFEFEGAHTNMFVQTNTMTTCAEGFALTNSGAIGQQPASGTTASDNKWTSASGYADTYTDASSLPAGSKLFVRSSSYPWGPGTNLSLNIPYAYGPTLSILNVPTTYSCTQTPPTRVGHHESGPVTARQAQGTTGDNNTVKFLEQVVQDSIPYPMYFAQNSFINKNNTYRTLKYDKGLMNSSSILTNFFSSNSNSSWALFCTIEDSLFRGNYSYANTLVSGYSPACAIEQNHKRFYEIYVNAMQGNGTTADSLDLKILASSCPMLNGTIVFQARAFRNSLLNGFENYEDNCPENENKRSLASWEIKTNNSLFVYPNPSNGKIYISGFAVNERINGVEVSDVTGKIVTKQQVVVVNGVIELNLNFNNGVYFIKVISEDRANKIEKIIISK